MISFSRSQRILRNYNFARIESTMTSEERKALIQRYAEAYNAFDVDGMPALMHEDVVFENVSNGAVKLVTRGKDELRKQAEFAAGAFSSHRQVWSNYSEANETAAVNIDYEGALAVDPSETPKKGQNLQLKGKTVFGFKDGKIILLKDYN